MRITPFGAAGTVTGSMYLIETDSGKKFIVEAGFFQGHHEKRNYEPLPFDPSEIEHIVISHVHLDHIGRLPILVKHGFNGQIISTPANRDLASIMLMDAAHVQEEEYQHQLKRGIRRGEVPPEPLYDIEDVILTMSKFNKTVNYEGRYYLYDDVVVTFRDAGHILGSSFLELEVEGKKIIFSGDLGNRGKPIIRDPEYPAITDPDLLMIESTYGNRDHRSVEESVEELKEAIVQTLKRGGNVIIPSFALERAQDILFYLREFKEKGIIPRSTPVFLDSPLAINATKIFLAHTECFDEKTLALLRSGKDPFRFEGLHFTRSANDSKKINNIQGGAIIIAGSGMCNGGRVKHQLKHNLWREESSVIFVGYQAKGTLGRRIVDGEKEVEIYGERIVVRAQIYTINGFSGHAGRSTLIDWANSIKGKKRALVVHGEPDQSAALADALKDIGYSEVQIAEYGVPVEV